MPQHQVENKAITMLCSRLRSHDVIIDYNNDDEKSWLQFRSFIFQPRCPFHVEVSSAPRAVSLMNECAQAGVPSEAGSQADMIRSM